MAVLVLALVGCSKNAPSPVDPEPGMPKDGAAINESGPSELKQRVKWVAAEYQKWGRVDDEARWAPYLCRNPNPSLSRFSKSKDLNTHGRKLYFVFAKYQQDYSDYVPPRSPQMKSQVIVKQSWHSVEAVPPPPKPDGLIDSPHPGAEFHSDNNVADYFQPYASRHGKLYRTGKQGPLFIMMKVGEDDPAIETDAGWVYATIEPDTREITGLGRIASCMKCHLDAPYDRLFGLPK